MTKQPVTRIRASAVAGQQVVSLFGQIPTLENPDELGVLPPPLD